MGRRPKAKEVETTGVENIEYIVNDLFPYLKNVMVDLKKQKTVTSRLGVMSEAVRMAVAKSSLGMYNGRPYVFTGKVYEPLRFEDIRNAVYELMKMFKMGYSELSKYLTVAYACQEFVKSKELEVNPSFVVFRNGVLDVDTGEFVPHSKDYPQITMADFDYDPTAECPRWEKFLNQVLPTKTMQAILQEFIGCIYIDRKKVKLEHMLILKGAGSNGKGVIFETVSGIVGNDNITNFGLDALLTGMDQKKNIALMNGKRVNYCTEIQAIFSGKYTDKLKTIISGEPTEARAIYGENFIAQDLPLLIANCNKLPKLEDVSYGMQRRVLIIPFEKVIPVEMQDHLLSKRLAKEYSGIFNWIMEGRARYIKRDFMFTRSEEVRQTVEEFVSSSSNVIRFANDRQYYPVFESIADIFPATIQVKELYAEYDRWCRENKEKPKTQIMFSKDLIEAGFTRIRKSSGIFFQVYGESASQLLKKREEDMEMFYSGRTGRSHRPLFANGTMYGRGDFNAAFYAHVSRPWLTMMRIKGKLDDVIHYHGATPIYDIDALVKKIDKLGAYVDHDRKITALAQREEEKMEAIAFNETMVSLGQPFRKWVFGMTTWKNTEIIVPNEWEYSEESAALVMKENAEKSLMNIE